MGLWNWLKRLIMYQIPEHVDDLTEERVQDLRRQIDEELDMGTPVSETPAGKLWHTIMYKAVCPDCNKPARFLAGPVGGMSQNIECSHCGHWYNVTPAIGIAEDLGFKGGTRKLTH